jgi:hypothetical protein
VWGHRFLCPAPNIVGDNACVVSTGNLAIGWDLDGGAWVRKSGRMGAGDADFVPRTEHRWRQRVRCLYGEILRLDGIWMGAHGSEYPAESRAGDADFVPRAEHRWRQRVRCLYGEILQ